MKEKTSSQIHIDFLRRRYGKKAEAWKGAHDDRKLFSNIYFMLIEAYEAVDGIEASYVITSLNRTCREEQEVLDRIAEVFKGREALS